MSEHYEKKTLFFKFLRLIVELPTWYEGSLKNAANRFSIQNATHAKCGAMIYHATVGWESVSEIECHRGEGGKIRINRICSWLCTCTHKVDTTLCMAFRIGSGATLMTGDYIGSSRKCRLMTRVAEKDYLWKRKMHKNKKSLFSTMNIRLKQWRGVEERKNGKQSTWRSPTNGVIY